MPSSAAHQSFGMHFLSCGFDVQHSKLKYLRQPLAFQRFLYLRPRRHARLVGCEIL
jgi:hypothetical protein